MLTELKKVRKNFLVSDKKPDRDLLPLISHTDAFIEKYLKVLPNMAL